MSTGPLHGCSEDGVEARRRAVWHELEAGTPLEDWEGCTAVQLVQTWGAAAVHLFASVGSTNDVARRLAESGASDGTVVLAEEQRAGRGRAGRSWASAPGLGLWISYIARPDAPVDLASFPLHVAIAVAEAIDGFTDGETVQIKWPNDLLLGGLKFGGILCEGVWQGPVMRSLVVGVGLNLLHAAGDLPPDLRGRATSLRLTTPRPIARFEVATIVVKAVRRALVGARCREVPLGEWAQRDALYNRQVQVLDPETGSLRMTGRALGIAPRGELRIAAPDGIREVRSGTVRMMVDTL